MTQQGIRFGLDTFGGMNVKLDGTPETAAQVIRDIVEQGKLADELGLSNFNVGEHHRDDRREHTTGRFARGRCRFFG